MLISIINPFTTCNLALTRETLSSWFGEQKGADQPAHSRRLIHAFYIQSLERIITKLAIGEISNFNIFSVAQETGLSLALSETQKTGCVATRPNLKDSSIRFDTMHLIWLIVHFNGSQFAHRIGGNRKR